MKSINPNVTTTALVLAIASVVCGQEKPAVVTEKPAAAPAASAGSGQATTATPKSSVRFEGTDLHLGNLPPVTFHGFASQGFLLSDTYDYLGRSKSGSFRFSEFALNASSSPFARTRVSAQAFMFDVGKVGEYDLALDYAVADYSFCDEFGVRGGRIRRPEGIYNAIQDIDLARTSVLLPQGMYDSRWRDFSGSIDGGSLYGNIGLGKAGSLSYEAYAGMISLTENGGVARQLQDELPQPPIGSYTGVNGCPLIGAQLWWTTPLPGLRAGVAVLEGFGLNYDYRVNPPFGPGPINSSLNIPVEHYSLEYQWKSWTFQTEYRNQNIIGHNTSDGALLNRTRSRTDTWYVSAAYRVNPWLEIGTYYTEDYADVANRSGAGTAVPADAYQKDVALSFRFDPKPWWVLKMEGHCIHGTALLQDNANNPVRDEDAWFMLALKTTFSF